MASSSMVAISVAALAAWSQPCWLSGASSVPLMRPCSSKSEVPGRTKIRRNIQFSLGREGRRFGEIPHRLAIGRGTENGGTDHKQLGARLGTATDGFLVHAAINF